MREILYETCRTDYRNDTSTNYARILRIKKGIGVDIKFNLISRDDTHLAIRELAINVSGSTAKIYDLRTETANAGINILFVESTNYFTLYVRGNYVGNAVTLQLEKVSLANQVEFIHYGKYTKSVVLFTADGEKEIPLSVPAKSNGKRTLITQSNLQNSWQLAEGFYDLKDGVCYFNLSVRDGNMTDGTFVMSGLPIPRWSASEGGLFINSMYNSYTDEKYYGCISKVDGNGSLKIAGVKGNKSLMVSGSYPTRESDY